MVNVNNLVKAMSKQYDSLVKPHIDDGNYNLASIAMRDITSRLGLYPKEITIGMHSGYGYMSTVKVLYERLISDNPIKKDVDEAVNFFEVYKAQVTLLNE